VFTLTLALDLRRPAVLRRYVSDFGPQFAGLRGGTAPRTHIIKRYRVTYTHQKPYPCDDHQVGHGSALFIFGPNARARLPAKDGAPAEIIAADLRHLLPTRHTTAALEHGGSQTGT